ncbi:MAG: hypothetical protein NTZ83_01825 [Candidatus Pacearchaeota archaeon]|nr:hypothetical protein [Candidatus Pacearchaeota archaeon]
MEKPMKDMNFKVRYKKRFIKASRLEKGLNFLKSLPITVMNFEEDDNLEVMFAKSGGVFVFPEKGSLTYSGFENIKDCAIEYDRDRVQIFTSKAFEDNQKKKLEDREETHYYLHAEPNNYKK